MGETTKENVMKAKAFVFLFLCLGLVATMLIQIQKPLTKGIVLIGEVAQAAKQRVVEVYGNLPLAFEDCFEINCGQTDPQVNFLSLRQRLACS